MLMSSSAPRAFSIATPNTLYNRAVERQSGDFSHVAYACANESHMYSISLQNALLHVLPTDPNVLAHDAPCRVTMFIILEYNTHELMKNAFISALTE